MDVTEWQYGTITPIELVATVMFDSITISSDIFGYADPLVEMECMSVASDHVTSATLGVDGT